MFHDISVVVGQESVNIELGYVCYMTCISIEFSTDKSGNELRLIPVHVGKNIL